LPIGNIGRMEKPEIIAELDEYCRLTGRRASTVTASATGNPRLRERLLTRIERTEADVERLRKFMLENPPASKHSEVPGQ